MKKKSKIKWNAFYVALGIIIIGAVWQFGKQFGWW